jgi:hypothetical protein
LALLLAKTSSEGGQQALDIAKAPTPSLVTGHVRAPDVEQAIEEAVKEFEITAPQHQNL